MTHRIAAEGPCEQARDIPKLVSRTVALVDAHRVPHALQEQLTSGVNALAAEAPVCLPSTPVSTAPPPPAAPAPRRPAHPHPPHPHPPHGHHHGHGHDR